MVPKPWLGWKIRSPGPSIVANLRNRQISLRKDQHTVGADRKRGVAGKAVVRARLGNHIGARMTFEGFAVTLPIAVETELPDPGGREADDVAVLWLVEEVRHDHDVIARSALVPTVEGDDLTFVVRR